MMVKRLIQAFIVTMALSVATVGFAAPDAMEIDDDGTVDDLITIISPAEENVTTYNEVEPISVSGREGVSIAVYVYDNGSSKYRNIMLKDDEGELVNEIELGASGLFAQELDLVEGVNQFALRAQLSDEVYQVEKIGFTLMKALADKIKGLPTGYYREYKDLLKNANK
ncbi:hypothetical protein [Petroclostridium sp. X23]|uniref:hypothetical protein n=1 Tax=Petroclostridium sp. X23 TaxID=3045146 RepID=UPI0024ADCED1|nr:hypothetical protein [Petroclostridium sp. X23]WHH57402.1 hypothetical protein QKW49_16385 [Petroclostridium sp. X23]